jgi:decaprenylphospho-beta-D-erythro-pentofuranosid-2-ulose 2-reductase
MLNAFHSPQSVALIGATSEIGQSIVRALPLESLEACFVVARHPKDAALSLMQYLPSRSKLHEIEFQAGDSLSHKKVVDRLFAEGDVDIAILAIGVLGNDPALIESANALDVMNINYVASCHLMLLIADRMKLQGHGQILVISSFAQTRPRVDNFIYGSSKAGLDFMARGLNDSLIGSGVSIHILRPGFVRTRMTRLMSEAPFTLDPDEVGKLAVKLLESGDEIGYAPPMLKVLASIFTLLPSSIFRKLSTRK